MLDTLFSGLFDSSLTSVISVTDFLLCLGTALLLGLVMAFAYMYRTRYTKSFVVTLALLPAVVCVVIMLVNGNVGTGVAVAGAFSLVRFRSVPGTAKEICTLFLAMGARADCRDGLPRLFRPVYGGHVPCIPALQPAGPGIQKECGKIQNLYRHHPGGSGLHRGSSTISSRNTPPLTTLCVSGLPIRAVCSALPTTLPFAM